MYFCEYNLVMHPKFVTYLAIVGGIAEPIGVPNICLYYFPLNIKVEQKLDKFYEFMLRNIVIIFKKIPFRISKLHKKFNWHICK